MPARRVPVNDLERFYASLILGRHPQEPKAALESLLRDLSLRPETEKFLRQQDPARLFIYRSLVRGTLERAVCAAIPRTVARLGASFAPLFRAFLEQARPGDSRLESRFLRDTTSHFIAFCRSYQLVDEPPLPDFLWDLASFEAVRIIAAAEPEEEHATTGEIELTRGLLFVESARLLELDYAVHLLRDEDLATPPEKRPSRMLAFRDPENEVRFLELSPLAFAILERLLAGEILGQAVTQACEETQEDLDDTVLSGAAQVLARLSELGALIGPCPAPE